MAFKDKKKDKFQSARESKRERVKEAGASPEELGAREARASAWGRAKKSRDEEFSSSPEGDRGRPWPASDAMREALGESLSDLCEKARRGAERVESEALGAPDEARDPMAPGMERALGEWRAIWVALETVAEQAGAEGLLPIARERLLAEMQKGAGAPFERVARQLGMGVLARLGVEDLRDLGDEEGGARLAAEAGEIEELARWAGDEAFWAAVTKEEPAPREPTATERVWSHGGQRAQTLGWGEALARLAALSIAEPRARAGALGLWDRFAEAMDKAELAASWGELGEEAGELGRAGRLDEQGLRETLKGTQAEYWLGARAALRGQGSASEEAQRLSGLILGQAIELAKEDPDTRSALAERLWGGLDTEGIWRWGQLDAKAPLEALQTLSLPWEDATFVLKFSTESERLAWAAPAFAAAGLGPRSASGGDGNWFGAETEARARMALEGVYALMESRELKASVEKARPRARPGL